MSVTVNSSENPLQRGMDPKPLVLDFCKPQCIYWKEKLERCEKSLEYIIKTNPTKSCLYPMRDWVTCVEACVSDCWLGRGLYENVLRAWPICSTSPCYNTFNLWFMVNRLSRKCSCSWRELSATMANTTERQESLHSALSRYESFYCGRNDLLIAGPFPLWSGWVGAHTK